MNLLMSQSQNEEEGDTGIVYDEREVSNWCENQKLWSCVIYFIRNLRGTNFKCAIAISTVNWKRLKDVLIECSGIVLNS